MSSNLFALCVVSVISLVGAAPAFSQVVIDNDPYSQDDSVDANTESRFLNRWNRHHDSQNRWNDPRSSFGPDDVINLLEARGYRVRNVEDVGERYLVRASRGGDDLLVSVSRAGDIMGVVHDRR